MEVEQVLRSLLDQKREKKELIAFCSCSPKKNLVLKIIKK